MKKKAYPSPYLEPLPINEGPWYEERAEEELHKKVQMRLTKQKKKKEQEEFERKLAEQKRIEQEEKAKKVITH